MYSLYVSVRTISVVGSWCLCALAACTCWIQILQAVNETHISATSLNMEMLLCRNGDFSDAAKLYQEASCELLSSFDSLWS